MDVDDETEKNENTRVSNVSLEKQEKSKEGLRKSFIPHKKRVILQELEPISESNILEDCSKFSSKGSTPFTHNSRHRKNLEKMSQSSEECTNSSRVYSSTECTESELVIPETPPVKLRLRIKEAQEMSVYLEKELAELREFTTNEKQILAAEKGVKQLEEHNNQLSEQNIKLHLEVEEMKKLNESQNNLMSDMNRSFNEMKNNLEQSYVEKDLVNQELDDLKRKFVDEQTEKQILETKWKQREDDLKKSLEEAWGLLHVKEERILKMNEKISSLYSEREKAKNLNLTFGGQFLPVNNEYNLETIDKNIGELFELSFSNFPENEKSSDLMCKDISKGGSLKNSEKSTFVALQEELKKCKDSLDFNKKQLEDFYKNLASKELAISHYENNLSVIVQDLSEFLSEDSISAREKCNEDLKVALIKIKSDIKSALSLGKSASNGNCTTEKVLPKNINEVECTSDSNSSPYLGDEIFPVNVSMPKIKQNEQETSSTISDFHSSNKDVSNLKANLHTVNSQSQTDIDYLTMMTNEATLISLGNKVLDFEQHGKNCGSVIVSLGNNVLQSEQSINDNEEKMALENKLIVYKQAIKNHEEEIDLLQTKVSNYQQIVDEVENKLSVSQEKVKDYEENIKILEAKIDKLKNNEESLRNHYVHENEAATDNENISIKSHCLNVSSQTDDIDSEIMKFDQEKLISLKKQVFCTEKNDEEKVLLLQNQIIDYEIIIKNSKDELTILQSKISDYDQTIKENEEKINELQNLVSDNESSIKNKINEINILENKISNYEEKYKKNEEEINLLQNIILENEQTIDTNKEEMLTMQNKIMEYEEIVKNYGEEKDIFLNNISSYEETIANSREELTILQSKISDYDQTIKENGEKINELQNLVLDNESSIKNKINEINILENKISNYEEEMLTMQNKIMEYEEIVKNYGEEKDIFLNNISSYEETIANSREELTILQSKISDYDQTIKENGEKINELQNLVLGNESSIKNKINEINILENKISNYEEKYKKNEEEMLTMQNKIMEYEEIVKNYEEEKDIFLNNISSYEETIANSRKELTILQSKISDYDQTIKENEEKINELQNLVSDNESSIKNKINILENKISNYEEKYKKNEEEINLLQNIILENEQTIDTNKEEMLTMQNKIMEYEEIVKNYGEEKDIFLNNISSYEETIANSREELTILQSKISDYDQTIKENGEKINELQNLVLDNESSIKNKINEINILENKISNYEEEMLTMQNKIMEYEEIVKNYGEEKDIFLNNISSYEETIANSREELTILQSKISDYDQTIKENGEKINELQNLVLDNESSIKNKINEINILENKISNYEEEMLTMQNKIMEYEEIVKNYGEEKDIFLNNISSYEETIANSREELTILQSKISDYDQTIKENGEKINELQNLVLGNESSIKNKINEINILENKISNYEEKYKKNEEEINLLQNIILENEQTIDTNKEEMLTMQNKIMEYEEIVKNYGEEKDIFLNNMSSYEETIANSREELNTLQRQISDYAQTAKENEGRIDELQNLVLDNESSIKNKINEINILENKISNYEEEMLTMQNKIMEYEEIVKNYGEEKDIFLNNISSYEETIANSREELTILQSKISDYDQTIKENKEKINELQNLVSDNESSIKNKINEINILENKISNYEEKYKKNEEEMLTMQNKIMEYEEIVKNYGEEKDIFLNNISSYEETIANSREELTILQSKISGYDQTIKENEEKINELQNLVSDNESSIKNKINEINILENKISNYEEKYKKNEEEINLLQNIILENEQTIDTNKEEMLTMQNKIMEYEEIVKNYGEEKDIFLNNMSSYEETIANSREELNTLQRQISDYAQTAKENEGRIDELQHQVHSVGNNAIFDNTNTISGLDDLNKTEINYSMSSYSLNPFMVVEYIDRQNSATTLNSSTLDSVAQLEQSVLISKLPPTDYSVREYDPLASTVETSFTSKEYDTTLTEYGSKTFGNVFQENISLNQKYINIKSDDKIKALLSLLNNRLDVSATYDKICEQFAIVKEILDPTEDRVIYNFCEIIENLLHKEIASKKKWNDKMVLVNDTLINLHNIKDHFLELKNSCFSLEKITSEDFEIIDSHLKNLFLCNRELFAENEQLKENLKIALLSEEKVSAVNEILKNELNSVLDLEKELQKVKECNSKLMVELKEKCSKENDINLLVEEIKKLLDPTFFWSANSLYSKLKQIHSTIIESVHHELQDNIQQSGLLPFLKNLLVENNSFKNMIDFSLSNVSNLKDNLLSLKPDISYLYTNVNSDLHNLFKKLSELYDRQEQETVISNELKENFQNLVLENTKLKGELHDLKSSNEDLKVISKDYDILLDKYKSLQEFVEEKDKILNDYFQFQEDVSLFINSLKDLYFIEEFKKIDSTCKFTSKSDSLKFLLWLQKFLEEIHNIHEYMLQNIQTTCHYTLSECIKELCKEKIKCNDDNCLGNSMKDSIHSYSEDLIRMKGTLELISADVVNLKHSFIHDLVSISRHVDSILLVSHKKEVENEKDKSDFRVKYHLLNEKYSELVISYELMKTELQQKENVIEEYMAEKDKSKKKNILLESQNAELNEMISKFDKETAGYKNLCHDLEREKEKVEENLKQYGTLVEYNVLKSDQIKFHKLLNILNTNMKEFFEDVLLFDADHFEDCLSVLTTTFDRLHNEINKYSTLELQSANLITEKDEQLKQIEELNDIIKETKKNMDNEIQILLTKEESNRNYFEETHNLYTKKLADILTLLDYQDCTKIDEVAWTFILDKIHNYKLMLDKNNECDVTELKDKIMSLEAQLYDAHDFKTKFSIELHSLKPDLDVSYLMKLSLAELQKTMIMAIIEKEKDVIADYEMKLSSNTDKIQQLEEQEKRRVNWVQEIEKENDRLISEFKKIQDDNEILKSNIKSKVDKINDLENQIMQRVSIQMNESIREREESINQLEVAVNEKQTLQLSLVSLNEKLKEKSKECEEIYSSLEKKAESIFNLEKLLSKCASENAILEKEVQSLREPVLLNLYNDNISLENDVNYKLQIEQHNMMLDNQEANLKEKIILQKKTETNTKSVSTDFDEEFEIGQIIEGSLNNHLVKIELLNSKIVELNSQLKQQSDKFDEDFKNQSKLIESLQEELDLANGLNAELKNNNAVILKQKEDAMQQYSLIEKLQVELNEQNNVLENKKVLLLKDKEALEQLLAIHSENEESSVDHLRKEIEILQNELCEEQNLKIQMQKQVEKMLCELHCIKNELASSEEARDNLLEQKIEAEKYKEEIKSITEELEHCQMKIKTLIQEKENSLSEHFNNLKLEKEINSTITAKLEQTSLELLNLKNEKELFMKEYHKNMQSEREMCSILNSDLLKMKEINRNLESDLQFIMKELGEKEAQLEEIKANCHLERACPFKKEVEDISSVNNNLSKQLDHERQTFELWKTNLEEDLHCKLLKISDLESKLNKETQCYSEALMTNSELHQVLLESQEKFKKLEDKLAMQRDVFIRDKSKLEIDIQSKDKLLKEFEGKLTSVKYQCEEFSKDICVFLQKVSDVLKEDVTDLYSAITLISKQILEKQSLMEELKEVQERAEQLEEECEVLNGDIKYHENVIGDLFEKNKVQEEKWISEKKELQRECLKSKDLLEKINTQENVILSLQTEIEKYEKSLKKVMEDKKAVELVKLELEGNIVELERNLNSLKNQEISCADGIKQEINHLKLELVRKHKMISKLEMRLESDTVPFQKKAEMAEKKVDELNKELRLLKQAQSLKQMSSVLTSPIAGLNASSQSLGAKEKMIEKLQQDIKQLITEKSALKLLAQNRRIQIKELQKQLGKRDTNSFQDAQTPI